MMRISRTISEHIAGCARPTQRKLQQLRRTIKEVAPGTTETVRYGIPTFQLNGKNLIHFAGYERHIGFYPGPRTIEAFRSDLKRFSTSRGAIQFPLDRPLPLALIRKMVRFGMDLLAPPDPFASLAAPAQRALKRARISSLKALARKTEADVAALHGMGPNAMKRLRSILQKHGLHFKRASIR
jgi:uncharacterized protein YdhG (YjbR/CyaY superfamily)